MNMPVSPSGALSPAPRPAAVSLMEAARALLPFLETGRSISTAMLRHAVESAYGDTDANGAWVWKDAYEALECAQILFMLK
ncbi:MAG: hypothetical protein E5V75_35100, partial [Mesorhizobium sp.]